MIWFDPQAPQNRYDLWLQPNGDNTYTFQVYDGGEWRNIFTGGSGSDSGSGCSCPGWVHVYHDNPITGLQTQINNIPTWMPQTKPTWWNLAATFSWTTLDLSSYATKSWVTSLNYLTSNALSGYVLTSDLKQIQLTQGGTNIGTVFGPPLSSNVINIETGTPASPQSTTNELIWSNSNGSISLGTLTSKVNSVLDDVELRYSPDADIANTANNNTTLPTSQAVKNYVDTQISTVLSSINNKQDKLQGEDGKILKWSNGIIKWVDDQDTWFKAELYNGSTSDISFTGNNFRQATETLSDGSTHRFYQPITNMEILAISNADQIFKAGAVIKFTAGSNASLRINKAWNILNTTNIIASTDGNFYVFGLTATTTYYLRIIMDSIIIYAVSIEAEQPQEDLNFDFVYWCDDDKVLNENWITNIRSEIANGAQVDNESNNNQGCYFMNCHTLPITWGSDNLQQLTGNYLFFAIDNNISFTVYKYASNQLSIVSGNALKDVNQEFESNNRTYHVYYVGLAGNALICITE